MDSIHRLYVDSNIFIYMFESEDRRAEQLRELFSAEPKGDTRFLTTSELTLAETLTGAYRKADESLIEIYRNWTISNPYLEVGPIQREILWSAAILRSRHNTLKLPDAIHLATAFEFNCSHFLTGDKRLRSSYQFTDQSFQIGNKSKELRVLNPEPDVLEHLIGQS
jgi:predicted nucleic acid-binding protein